ncbi:hypothetical protein VNI00_006747 [Paramarasmius palmivorus]|uniref:Uncharacterized protein n=1 Tax=Paramarasmius palmivorus TaxID=297713 RepID=A0AAW0D8Q5_9AGAR
MSSSDSDDYEPSQIHYKAKRSYEGDVDSAESVKKTRTQPLRASQSRPQISQTSRDLIDLGFLDDGQSSQQFWDSYSAFVGLKSISLGDHPGTEPEPEPPAKFALVKEEHPQLTFSGTEHEGLLAENKKLRNELDKTRKERDSIIAEATEYGHHLEKIYNEMKKTAVDLSQQRKEVERREVTLAVDNDSRKERDAENEKLQRLEKENSSLKRHLADSARMRRNLGAALVQGTAANLADLLDKYSK